MYITQIKLKNVRCFEEISIDLGESRRSLMIAGNNGIGKSALLRSIAMGLCDEASAGALLRELPGDFIRKTDSSTKKKDASITISLKDSDDTYVIETILEQPKNFTFENVSTIIRKNGKEIGWREFKWDKIFVAGYGAGLRTEGTEEYSQYFAPDAVYSLFKYTHQLQSSWSAWSGLQQVARDSVEDHSDKVTKENEVNIYVSSLLKKALILDDENDSIYLKPNGLFIKFGTHQVPVELDSLGDGYRAITTIILDFLSWQILKLNNKYIKDPNNVNEWEPLKPESIEGIMLIDEVEKHLHPLLQRQIILRLNEIFPNVQFIISTHSPLCISGTADVGENGYKIYKICRNEEGSAIAEPGNVPRGLRTDQVLVDYFDLPTTLNISVERKLNDLKKLYSEEHRNDDKIASLLSELESYNYELAENARDRDLQKRVLDFLSNEEESE